MNFSLSDAVEEASKVSELNLNSEAGKPDSISDPTNTKHRIEELRQDSPARKQAYVSSAPIETSVVSPSASFHSSFNLSMKQSISYLSAVPKAVLGLSPKCSPLVQKIHLTPVSSRSFLVPDADNGSAIKASALPPHMRNTPQTRPHFETPDGSLWVYTPVRVRYINV